MDAESFGRPLARATRGVIGGGAELRAVGGGGPFLGEQELGFVGGDVDDLPDATTGEVDPVDEIREFPREANPHSRRIAFMLA